MLSPQELDKARRSLLQKRHFVDEKSKQVPFKNNCFVEMCSGSEEGAYLRLIDFCIIQL